MTSRVPSTRPHQTAFSERDIARAEADYQRVRQAYVDLARSEHNEVALAMVGADMERANALLRSLGGRQPLSSTPGPAKVAKRAAPQDGRGKRLKAVGVGRQVIGLRTEPRRPA